MQFKKIQIRGSPFVGVFCKATDHFVLIPVGMPAKEKKTIEKTLNVDAIETSIANSSLIGVLSIANRHGIIVPSICEQNEIDHLTAAGINAKKIPTVEALGNLVAVNDNAGICSPSLREETKATLTKELKIEFTRCQIAGSDLAGSASVVTNRGFVCHPQVRETEFQAIEKALQTKGSPTSANYGDLFIGNSIVANSYGFLAGPQTTGYELMAIDDAFQ